MQSLDEKRIQEIVEKVMARLGGADLPSSPLEAIDRAIVKTLPHVREIAEYAVAETGLGRADDKVKKNTLVATKTPGTEILRPITYSGDFGLMITERAPYG